MPDREDKGTMVGGIKRLFNGIFHSTEKENSATFEGSLKATTQPLPPEKPRSRCLIDISDSGVRCKHPDGTVESIAWDDLESVTVETTGADIFWILSGASSRCVVPQGAVDNFDLLEAFQELPGFDNNVVIKTMTGMDTGKFLCWKRGDGHVTQVDPGLPSAKGASAESPGRSASEGLGNS